MKCVLKEINGPKFQILREISAESGVSRGAKKGQTEHTLSEYVEQVVQDIE